MNAYVKSIAVTVGLLAASVALAARSAEPEPAVIVLPAPVVTALLQYLGSQPYQNVAGLMGNVQRCLQDQLPDAKGITADRGACPEITTVLQHLQAPVALQPKVTPPPHGPQSK